MATKKTFEEKIVKEKLAVFTFNDAMQEPSFRRYFIKNWNNLTVGLKKSTILFIGGVHGQKTGKFGGHVSIKTLTNQVRFFVINFCISQLIFNNYSSHQKFWMLIGYLKTRRKGKLSLNSSMLWTSSTIKKPTPLMKLVS